MAAELESQGGIASTLVRGKGGEFEITADGVVIFSKKQEGRFPDTEEILTKLREPG